MAVVVVEDERADLQSGRCLGGDGQSNQRAQLVLEVIRDVQSRVPEIFELAGGLSPCGQTGSVRQLYSETKRAHPPRLATPAHVVYACSMAITSRPADWHPASWRDREATQPVEWPDAAVADAVRQQLRGLPPLVFAGEARRLTRALGEVAAGRAFVLQAGDCAESFDDFSADSIRDKLKVILQMAVVLTYGSGVPVLKVGRIAGQFAKPRSSPTERVGDLKLPAFRGHIVNDDVPVPAGRVPDPTRMLTAYHQSASTLNLLRAFTKGGFADLSQVHSWNQEFLAASAEGRRYEAIAEEIDRALCFMRACGVDLSTDSPIHQVDLFTSHEALLLDYEEAMTRQDSLTGDWYDCSAHFLWVGERTRQIEGAHMEFATGIGNPVGCKIGPAATPEEAVEICERLNPERIPGRLTLVSRMGVDAVRDKLPPLIERVRESRPSRRVAVRPDARQHLRERVR